MTTARRALGSAGESAACRYLEARGYRVVERNARAGGVEIDLVAERRGVVVFVEVKTRRGRRHGAAHDAVDARKRARLVHGAAAWLHERRRRARAVRFDVVACEARADGAFEITHWPGAFDAGG